MAMNLTDIIACIALAVSFFSIWLQTKNANKQLLITNICEYTKRYQEIILQLPESILYKDFDIDSLSDKEREKILRTMWIYFDLCYEEYSLYHHLKLIDKKLWTIWESGIKTALSREAFIQSWYIISEQTSYNNDRKFVEFINKIIKTHKYAYVKTV